MHVNREKKFLRFSKMFSVFIDLHSFIELSACLNDDVIGKEFIADYILWWMNKHQLFNYLDYMGLEEPCDNVRILLTKYCVKNNMFLRMRSTEGGACKSLLYVKRVLTS